MGAEAILAPGRSPSYQASDAAPPLVRVVSAAEASEVGLRDGVHTDHRVDELCEHMAAVCASAVDPLEIAAALEAEGMGDRSVHRWYGLPDVFALAEEMYRRVPRRPQEPPPATNPYQRQILRPMSHAALYGLPAVCFPAAAGLLTGRAALMMVTVSMLVSWAISQGLAYLGYLRLGWTEVDQARRLLRAGLAVGMVVVVLALTVTALVVPAHLGSYAFGVGQGAYMLGACVLMVLGAERLLFLVLIPGVVGASVYLVLGRPHQFEQVLWVALAATPILALVLAVVFTRRTRPTVTGRVFVAAELHRALPSMAFGFLAAALVALPIAASSLGDEGGNVGAMLAAVPLSLSMGAAEFSLSWYRRTTQRLVRDTGELEDFSRQARLALLAAVLQYLTVASLLTSTAAVIALKSGYVGSDQSIVPGLLAYLALGGAMFISLLLHAFGVGYITLLACAAALAVEFVFRDWMISAQVIVYLGLFGFLCVYAMVVLGRLVWHTY